MGWSLAAAAVVDVFGGWTFRDALPGLYEYATQFYEAMGPMAWLVGGILVGRLAIITIIDFIRAAVGRADEE